LVNFSGVRLLHFWELLEQELLQMMIRRRRRDGGGADDGRVQTPG